MTHRHPIIATLRELRHARGIPQDALAAKAGVSIHVINTSERGEGNPTLASLEAWAGALGKRLALEDERTSTDG